MFQDPVFTPQLPADYYHPRYWGSWLGIGAFRCCALLSPKFRDKLAAALAPWVIKAAPKRRIIAETNLALCFPEWSPSERAQCLQRSIEIGLKTIFAFGELELLADARFKTRIEIEGWEHIEAAQQRGQPLILVTPHCWAIDAAGRAIVLQDAKLTFCTMMKTVRNPIMNWYINKERHARGGKIYERKAGLKPVIKSLQQGYHFYYLPDEDLGRKHSMFVPFFGQPKATVPALGRLCKVSGAKALLHYAVYDDIQRRYKVIIADPLGADFPSQDPYADTLRMNQAIEALIRTHPEQYMWFLRFFQTPVDPAQPNPYQTQLAALRHLAD